MSRDYKSRANPPRKQARPPVAGWIWFAGGLAVGLFISALVWLKMAPDGVRFPQVAAPVAKPKGESAGGATKTRPEKSAGEPASKPRFDFYTILPEMEVVVPDPEPAVKDASGMPVAGVQATSGADYMLQMGSFKKHSDADRLKASLALVGISAEIQKVSLSGDEVFHRVRSGPYTGEQANTLRARLRQNNISSLVIKLKQ
jgi:cell division protein FtsN